MGQRIVGGLSTDASADALTVGWYWILYLYPDDLFTTMTNGPQPDGLNLTNDRQIEN